MPAKEELMTKSWRRHYGGHSQHWEDDNRLIGRITVTLYPCIYIFKARSNLYCPSVCTSACLFICKYRMFMNSASFPWNDTIIFEKQHNIYYLPCMSYMTVGSLNAFCSWEHFFLHCMTETSVKSVKKSKNGTVIKF